MSEGRSHRSEDAALVGDAMDHSAEMALIADARDDHTTTAVPEEGTMTPRAPAETSDETKEVTAAPSPSAPSANSIEEGPKVTKPPRLDDDEMHKANPLEMSPPDAVTELVEGEMAKGTTREEESTEAVGTALPPAAVTPDANPDTDLNDIADKKDSASQALDADNKLSESAEDGKTTNDLSEAEPSKEQILLKKKEKKPIYPGNDADQFDPSEKPHKQKYDKEYSNKVNKAELEKYSNDVAPKQADDKAGKPSASIPTPTLEGASTDSEGLSTEAVITTPEAISISSSESPKAGSSTAESTTAETLETNESNPMNIPVVVVSDQDKKDEVESTTVVDMTISPVTSSVSDTSSSALPYPHALFSKCATGQFQCSNGTSREGAYCVPLSSKCDSVNDCSDGSDEAKCIEEGCPGNFQCSNGQCLKRHLVCNSVVDCNDGSDEMNCENWQCQFDEFQCPSKRCIPVLSQCDGKPDCESHMDERNCQDSCGNDEYLCPEGWCIPLTQRCDGMSDCANGEDEQLCDCSLDQFKCHTGGCVAKTNVCDGVDHCPDLSDEWNCIRLENETSYLQIRNADNEWLPVCGSQWDSKWSDMACQSLGFSDSATTEFHPLNESNFMSLKEDATLESTTVDGHRLSSVLRNSKQACVEGAVEIQCQEFTCGTHSPSAESIAGRLAGGDGAASGSQPWVAILYNSHVKSSCTASIISPRWLLASYNCLHIKDRSLSNKDWVAYAGGSMFDKNPDTQMRSVRTIVPYPQVKYNQLLYTHDIALVELQNPLQLTNKVGAICLPEKNVESQQICVTAGWGFSNPGETNFSQFYLLVPLMDLSLCNSTKHYAGKVGEDSICAGFTDSKSPCYNDEGSPLMCSNENSVWELQGVLSYHSNCGRGHHPSVFSSISHVRSWIKRTVGSYFERKTIFNVRR